MLVICDILLIAVAFGVFSLFHFILPQTYVSQASQATAVARLAQNEGSALEFVVAESDPQDSVETLRPGAVCDVSRGTPAPAPRLRHFAGGCATYLQPAAAGDLNGGKTSAMTFGGSLVNQPTKGGRMSSDIIFIGE